MIPHHQVAIDMSEMLLPVKNRVFYIYVEILLEIKDLKYEMNNYLEGIG